MASRRFGADRIPVALMPLTAGTRLGPYEILSPLGAGGMGEVYRARDTRLERTVAVKVLPSHMSASADVRQRFEREAKTISQLSHPHICALYDVGSQDGVEYLVMELLEGETLSDRLSRGPLPLEQTLRFGVEIADALDKAHRQGIVHRDLKPGNVMLTKSGVKLLDFGLAKVMVPATQQSSLTALPTQQGLTQEGTILGTFQYMAPEQLEGKEADARTDIFAFGAVLFEMATGNKAFSGATQASLIGAILHTEPPPISSLQNLFPRSLDRVVKTCLAKDPDDRWQSAHDVAGELKWIGANSADADASAALPGRRRSRLDRAGWFLAGALALVLAAGAALVGPRLREGPRANAEARFSLQPPPGTTFSVSAADTDFAISPDQRQVVFAVVGEVGRSSSTGEASQLCVRGLSSIAARVLPGTDGARYPFWSPDGKFVGFIADRRLKKVALAGGSPQVLAEASGEVRGATWRPDGSIFFGGVGRGLMRVPEDGGAPTVYLPLDAPRDEFANGWPAFLPDGRHFVYESATRDPAQRGLYLYSVDSKRRTRLLETLFRGAWVEPGYLLFMRGATLMAQKLALDPPRLTGDPLVVADGLPVNPVPGNAPFTAAGSTIAYRAGGSAPTTQLTWFDRAGKPLGVAGPEGADISVSLSPDGTRAAVARVNDPTQPLGGEPTVNVWVVDLVRGIPTRITLDPANGDENPTWSPDGRRLAYASHIRGARAEVFLKDANGSGASEQLTHTDASTHPIDWSRDGRFLLLQAISNAGVTGLNYVPLAGKAEMRPFVETEFPAAQGQFSPDSRFVAYSSGESGRPEVYVRPFPEGAEKWQVSSAGGASPRFRRDGRELYYVAPDGTLMAVAVALSPRFEAAPPVALFKTTITPTNYNFYGGAAPYDVSGDGTRFLVNAIARPGTTPSLNLILNWAPPSAAK